MARNSTPGTCAESSLLWSLAGQIGKWEDGAAQGEKMDYIDKWFMDSDVAPENKELYVQLKEVARPYIDKWMPILWPITVRCTPR